MMQQLRRAADELGRTVVMVMHDLNFAAAYSDQIMAMADGQDRRARAGALERMDAWLLTRVFGTPVQVMDVDGSPTAPYCLGKACPPGRDCAQEPCCCELHLGESARTRLASEKYCCCCCPEPRTPASADPDDHVAQRQPIASGGVALADGFAPNRRCRAGRSPSQWWG